MPLVCPLCDAPQPDPSAAAEDVLCRACGTTIHDIRIACRDRISSGRYQGRLIAELAAHDPAYLDTIAEEVGEDHRQRRLRRAIRYCLETAG